MTEIKEAPSQSQTLPAVTGQTVVEKPTRFRVIPKVKDSINPDSDYKLAIRIANLLPGTNIEKEVFAGALTGSKEQYPMHELKINAPFTEKANLIGEIFTDQEKIVIYEKVKNPFAGYLDIPEDKREVQLVVTSTVPEEDEGYDVLAIIREEVEQPGLIDDKNDVEVHAEQPIQNTWDQKTNPEPESQPVGAAASSSSADEDKRLADLKKWIPDLK